MGTPDDFLRYGRQKLPKRPVEERTRDHREYVGRLPPDRLREQAARCTDFGIPFCHQYGCPART